MPSSNRTFRIFVSSTFSDLKEERNALQKRVFPKLQELCLQHGCRFQAIDLRWGVREEASYDQQTLRICLEEIKRCQKTKLKPNFIVLLGNRYGWRPAPPKIPQEEFQKIRTLLSQEDIVQLEKWYLLDKNAIPTEYVLQPRTGEYRNQENWALVEQQLRAVLLKAVVKLQLSENQLIKYFASATEQEIIQGLDDPEAEKHVFCFFRELEGIEQKPVKDLIEIDPKTGKIDHEANSRLCILKDKLRAHLGNNCFEYQASLTNEGITKYHIDNLCKDVYDSLASIIREEIKHISEVDPLDKEIDDHATFGQARAKFFVGREAALRKIEDYLRNKSCQPMAVFGESGSGKTALMAHALQESRKTYPQAEVIFRFIGATPASSDGRSLLESLSRQTARRYGLDESAVPSEYPKLVADFSEKLKLATPNKPLIIFLDALDQISNTDNAQNLSWLPSVLPENVHIVVSCLLGGCSPILEKKLSTQNVVLVKPMSRDDGKDLLNKWLNNADRRLQPDQESEVLDKFAVCGMPLYLKLAFEEARLWKSFTEKKELSSTVPGIILDMFKRLSSNENYGEKMFSHSLGYITAAKNGLTEDELLDVLSLDAEVFEDFKKSAFHQLTGDRLPVVIWSRLYFDLEPYLTERNADGMSLLGFYHRRLNDAVVQQYLKGDRVAWHTLLGHYFNGDYERHPQPLKLQEKGNVVYNLRKLSELPFQETYGELWSELENTLSDFAFIEAKCGSGMTYDLVADYKAALNALPENLEENREVTEHQERLRKYITDLIAFDSRIGTSFEIIPSFKPCDEKMSKSTKIPTRLECIQTFSKFVDSEAHNFINFASYPGFCAQQAINSSASGPVVDKAEKFLKGPSFVLAFRPAFNLQLPLVRTLQAEERIVCMSLTPDGRTCISGADDHTLQVWDMGTGQCRLTLKGHSNSILAIETDALGHFAVSAGLDKTVRVWNLENGDCVGILKGHTDYITKVAITPNGSLAVSASADKTLRVWNLESGNCLHTLTGHTEKVIALSVTADGRIAISGSNDKTARVWNLKTGECIYVLRGHRDVVGSVCISLDGSVATSGFFYGLLREGGRFKVWDLGTGKCVHSLKSSTVTAALSKDGRLGVTACEQGNLLVWDIKTGRCLYKLCGHLDQISSISLTPDGTLAVSGGLDGTIRLWDLTKGLCIRELNGYSRKILEVAITADGRLIVSLGEDGLLRVWDACGELINNEHFVKIKHSRSVSSICVTPDKLHLLSTDYLGSTLLLWGLKTCQPVRKIRTFAEPNLGEINVLSVSRDNSLIISGGLYRYQWREGVGRTLRAWDLKTRKIAAVFALKTREINTISLVPDGRLVVTGGADCLPYIWDIETEKYGILEKQQGAIDAIDVSPDGRLFAIGLGLRDNYGRFKSIDCILRIYDLRSGRCLSALSGHSASVTSVSFTPDGRKIVSSSADKTIRVWDLSTNCCPSILSGHLGPVTAMTVSADGKYLVSGSEDRSIRLWDINTGQLLRIVALSNPITALSSTGTCVIAGDSEGNMHFFKINNLTVSAPIVTPLRFWLFGDQGKQGVWANEIETICGWCGKRFTPEKSVIKTIQAQTAHLAEDQVPSLSLLNEAWEKLHLLYTCPHCGNALKFNPFIVDNKNRY